MQPASEPQPDEPPTVVEVPQEPTSHVATRGSRVTAEEAFRRPFGSRLGTGPLHAEEAARARGFGRIVAVIVIVALGAISFLDGDPTLERVIVPSLTAVLCISLWVALWSGREEEGGTVRRARESGRPTCA